MDHTNTLGHLSNPLMIASMSWYLIPVLVMIASLLGSTHCVSMCGGLALALPPQRSAQLAYHLGRLMGYLSLGALAGLAGQELLNNPWLAPVTALLMAVMFALTALKIWRGQGLHLPLPAGWLKWLNLPVMLSLKAFKGQGSLSGLLVGLLTFLLPCGWLYTFVLGALATRNLWLGALFLASFWLGTLPMMVLAPGFLQSWLQKGSRNQRRLVACLFLMAGLLSLGYKLLLPVHAGHPQAGLSQVSAEGVCHGVPRSSEHVRLQP